MGPEDVSISTADGKPVPLMSLADLIAQAKSAAGVSAGSQGDNIPGHTGHTLRITVRFNGEQHEFELPAPPEK